MSSVLDVGLGAQLLKAESSEAINNFVVDAIYLRLSWLTKKGPALKERRSGRRLLSWGL